MQPDGLAQSILVEHDLSRPEWDRSLQEKCREIRQFGFGERQCKFRREAIELRRDVSAFLHALEAVEFVGFLSPSRDGDDPRPLSVVTGLRRYLNLIKIEPLAAPPLDNGRKQILQIGPARYFEQLGVDSRLRTREGERGGVSHLLDAQRRPCAQTRIWICLLGTARLPESERKKQNRSRAEQPGLSKNVPTPIRKSGAHDSPSLLFRHLAGTR